MNLSFPLNAQIEITGNCNHNCSYCYNYWRDENEELSSLSQKKVKYIIDQLSENGIFDITITGGEPFIEKEILHWAIPYIKNKGIGISVNTNGAILESEDLDLIKEHNLELLISFPSHIQKKYNHITNSKNYKKVLNNLEILIKNNVNFLTNTVITKYNLYDLYETLRFLNKKLGIEYSSSTPMSLPNYINKETAKSMLLSKEDLKIHFYQVKKAYDDFGIISPPLVCIPYCSIPKEILTSLFFLKRGCGAGKNMITISSEGDVRPCPQSHLNIGNIFSKGINEIWEDMDKFRDEKVYLPKNCMDCNFKDNCSGGCRESGLNFSGEINGEDPYMFEAITNIENTSSKKITNFSFKTKFKLNPKLRLRKEGEGFIVGTKSKIIFLPLNFLPVLEVLDTTGDLNYFHLINDKKIPKELIEKFFQEEILLKN